MFLQENAEVCEKVAWFMVTGFATSLCRGPYPIFITATTSDDVLTAGQIAGHKGST